MQTKKICVMGLGYVGLPLLLLSAEKGYKTYGFDINKELIEKLKKGICNFKDKVIEEKLKKYSDCLRLGTDKKILNHMDIIIVCVPTPVDEQNKPDLRYLESACSTISENIKKDQLIIIESTVFPGTVGEIVLPILKKSNFIIGKDFYLAHCPERIDPGNKKYNVSNIPRVIAGITKKCTEEAYNFYSNLINADIIKLSSTKTAEATKMIENIFRDVNIALVNELARSFDILGIDITEVINGASTKPFAFIPHYPGCGVGGHCIPVDPYYLIERAKQNGFDHRFLSLARKINKEMPYYTIQKTINALKEIGKDIKNANIIILGLAYKGNVGDIRESPALDIIKELEKQGAKFDIYDPYVLQKSTVKDLNSALSNKDCVILATNHSEFKALTAEKLKEKNIKIVIDGRNFLDKESIKAAGIIYSGIGR